MCHFDADGKRYYPFGKGSGSEVADFILSLSFTSRNQNEYFNSDMYVKHI